MQSLEKVFVVVARLMGAPVQLTNGDLAHAKDEREKAIAAKECAARDTNVLADHVESVLADFSEDINR